MSINSQHLLTAEVSHPEAISDTPISMERPTPKIYDWESDKDIAGSSVVVTTFNARRQAELGSPDYQKDFVHDERYVEDGEAILQAAGLISEVIERPIAQEASPRTKIEIPRGPQAASTFADGLAHDAYRNRQIGKLWPKS